MQDPGFASELPQTLELHEGDISFIYLKIPVAVIGFSFAGTIISICKIEPIWIFSSSFIPGLIPITITPDKFFFRLTLKT